MITVVTVGFGVSTLTVSEGDEFFMMCVVLNGEAVRDVTVNLRSDDVTATSIDGTFIVLPHAHGRTHSRTHAHTHACTHTNTHTHARKQTNKQTNTHTHTHTNKKHTHTHTHSDYRPATIPSSVTILAGDDRVCFNGTIVDDEEAGEGIESFTITITSVGPEGVGITQQMTEIFIADNDGMSDTRLAAVDLSNYVIVEQ